ncbi:MAG: bifunctional demethylmenaquinone methyltransferase/2-methoxy-6-polyprenyl-1,4-benzoquinol methylase UbiE [Nitrospirae bacterium]|nr:bifunctional demethylmenaquinone methyltransferase/2-methoxy-6-polyprenyl-1,4-benzoquinol methylase UbiE [Nitrospirota bacterium]
MSNLSKETSKIQGMFSSIAPRYDLLNRVLSFGIDIYWRKFAVGMLPIVNNGRLLDVATGTADVAMEIIRQNPSKNLNVTGVDFSAGMLELGEQKVEKSAYAKNINLQFGDVNSLPFEDNTFDGAIIAFGIRNIPDYKKGISEMARVIKDGGRVVILEFTNTRSHFLKPFYQFYLTKILPWIGEIVSGRKGAYKYLSLSVMDFPDAEALTGIMQDAGLREVKYHLLTFGTVAVHVGIK